MANVNLTKVKRHIAALSPLQLDSLSEMRNCLLELLDSRFNTDPITGLRPLFFRTLRNADEKERHSKALEDAWLAWKFQVRLLKDDCLRSLTRIVPRSSCPLCCW